MPYWLSWFIFSSELENKLNDYVYPSKVHLAKGKKATLAIVYLRSLYAHLEECVADMSRSLGRYDVVSHIDSVFLQMFLWECFGSLASNPEEYSDTVPAKWGLLV